MAVFPDDDGPGFTVLPQFFVPAERIQQRVTRDRVPYDEWARRDLLTATPGPTVDYELVRAHLNDWADRYDVRLLAFDPWNATDLVTRLEKQDGFTVREDAPGQGDAVGARPRRSSRPCWPGPCAMTAIPILRWNVVERQRSISTTPGTSSHPRSARPSASTAIYALVMALDAMHRDTGTRAPEYQMIIVSPTL